MVQTEFQEIHVSAVTFFEGSLYAENTVKIYLSWPYNCLHMMIWITSMSLLEQTRKNPLFLSFTQVFSLEF